MILVTGDTHGDLSRLLFPNELNKEDYLIVCGDFGAVWYGSEKETERNERLSGLLPYTLLFVDGNHENFDALKKYPVTEWNGGKVQVIANDVIHLMRGQVYTIDGKKLFTFGGAASHDIANGILEPDDPDFYQKRRNLDRAFAQYRINHYSWWEDELPSKEEMDEGIRNLAANNWQVDYILTHCTPTSVLGVLGNGEFKPDRLTDYLNLIREKCQFKRWYFGHYHMDQSLDPQFHVIYESIREI